MEPSSPQQSHVISQQVFGSSRKLQFIGISPMDSLLTAIDHQVQSTKSTTHQTMSIESLLDSNGETTNKRRYPTEDNEHYQKLARRKANSGTSSSYTVPTATSSNSNTNTNTNSTSIITSNQIEISENETAIAPSSPGTPRMTLTCYHASVAQKSYGSEKRFLCPPPVVRVQYFSPSRAAVSATTTTTTSSSPCQLTMAVISENGDTPPLEQHSMLDDDDECSFKYLHVTGTAKAKQFSLRVDIGDDDGNNTDTSPSSSSSSFVSNPISIISKPSKKTSKARNVSTCILANQPVSLFNRINSQTVRTKYMTSENNQLCAKNGSWTPFDITILSIPQQYQPSQRPNPTSNGDIRNNNPVIPLIYGSELILRDTRTGVRSQPMIIRKVDKGRIVPGAYGPVSQMQKIALQLVSTSPSQAHILPLPSQRRLPAPPLYLSAMGITDGNEPGVLPAHSPHTTFLDYARSRIVTEGLDAYEKVDDYLCWTIVGISTFEHTIYDQSTTTDPETTTTSTLSSAVSSPLSSSLSSLSSSSSNYRLIENHSPPPQASTSPSSSRPSPPIRNITTLFPSLTTIQYQAATHTLDIVGQHLMQAAPSPKLLELWLGSHHGPLHSIVQPQPIQPHQTHLQVTLPSVQDLIVANHDRLVEQDDATTRSMELPLFLVREDGVVYHSGKALICDMLVNSDTGRWSIVDVRQ